MAGVIWVWSEFMTPLIGTHTLGSLVVLFTGTTIGVIAFAGMAKILRMGEFEQAMGLVQRKIGTH
jgi:putative peptidoglycan lipid II flippase